MAQPPANNGVDGGPYVPGSPTVSSVSPALASTAGGATLTVTGTRFSASTLFFINNIVANANVTSPTSATILSPPRPGVGPATITVRNPDGLNSTTNGVLSFYATQMNFGLSQYASLTNTPRGAGFGDLNGDGFQDVIITSQATGSYTIYLNNTTGGFIPQTAGSPAGPTFGTIGGQGANQTVKLVDINGDNKLDLLMVTQSNNMHYYLGTGTGLVGTPGGQSQNNYGTSATPQTFALADINNDTYLDVITANPNSSNIGLFLNTFVSATNLFPSGQYQTLNPGGQPTRVMTTDIDGDGKLDIIAVMSNNNGPTLSVAFGTGVQATPFGTVALGTFATYGTNNVNNLTTPSPQWMDLGDLNGDGRLDVVVVDQGTNTIRVFLSNGTTTATFQPPLAPITVGISPSQVALGDFNGDGKLDVVTANNASNNVTLLLGVGDGTFNSRQDFVSPTASPFAIFALDLNNDKKLDIATVNNTGTGALNVYLNTSQ